VQHDANEDADASHPKERAELVQELRIPVDMIRVLENLQIANQVDR